MIQLIWKKKVNVPTTKCAMKLQLSPLTQNIHWGNIQENINYGNQNVFQEEGQKILVLVNVANVAMATKNETYNMEIWTVISWDIKSVSE